MRNFRGFLVGAYGPFIHRAGAAALRVFRGLMALGRFRQEQAWRVDRLRNLLKVTCHDLSAPVQVISAHAELAEKGGPADWNAVKKAVIEQQRIIDFVQRDSGLLGTRGSRAAVPVRMAEVCEIVRFLFDGRAQAKGVVLELPRPEDLKEVFVLAQEVPLVHSVIGNAISNAIKFTESGGRVSLRVQVDDTDVVISVEDTGVGIPLWLQRKIRSSAAAAAGLHRLGTRGELGSGQGLSLMRYFSASFGGAVSWKSSTREDGEERSGTVVQIKLRRGFGGAC